MSTPLRLGEFVATLALAQDNALLRYVGCTGHAHEVATVFGDEIAIRAQTLVHDAANPAEVMRDVVAFATAGRPQDERDQIIGMIQQTAQQWAVHSFASGCEVAGLGRGLVAGTPCLATRSCPVLRTE